MTAGLTTRDPVHIFCLIYFFSLFLCQLRDESLPIKTFALRRQTSPLPLTTFFAILHFQNTQKGLKTAFLRRKKNLFFFIIKKFIGRRDPAPPPLMAKVIFVAFLGGGPSQRIQTTFLAFSFFYLLYLYLFVFSSDQDFRHFFCLFQGQLHQAFIKQAQLNHLTEKRLPDWGVLVDSENVL